MIEAVTTARSRTTIRFGEMATAGPVPRRFSASNINRTPRLSKLIAGDPAGPGPEDFACRRRRLAVCRGAGEGLYSVPVSLPIPFRWSAGRGAGLRGHRMGRRGHGARHDHDARAGLLLRRSRAEEEPRLDDRPGLRHLRPREPGVAAVGLH